MTKMEHVALRKLDAAERHLAIAYELLHHAAVVRPHTAAIGDNIAHINEEVRRERDALRGGGSKR